MIVRRIHFINQPAGTGGGGGPTPANVAWGPRWGGTDGDRYDVAVMGRLTALRAINSKSIGVQPRMPSLALASSKSIGVDISGSVLGAPFFQGIGITTQTAISASVVLTPDQTPASGDFLVVSIGSSTVNSAETFTAPSGWTLIRSTNNVAALGANLNSYYKLAGAGEPSSYTWTGGQGTAHTATIIRLTAVHTTAPINAESGSTGSATDPVSPDITTTAANCFMISVCAQANSLTQTYTPPAGYVERADHAGTNLGVTQVTSETATRVQAATGASGTKTHDSNQLVASNYCCHHIAIAPGSLVIA